MTTSPESTSAVAITDPADDKLDAAVFKIAGVVVIGVIMAILDMTVVNVALPTFKDEFLSTEAIVSWTMTGYTLSLATVIPLVGWACDRFGTKRLYLAALMLFVAGSVLCSFAWNIESLIAFRVIQGFGGGMLMPLVMTILTHAAGPARVGRVMAVLGVPMLLGPISGPILGGWLIEVAHVDGIFGGASWPWIFLINLPIGIVALAAAWIVLPNDAPEPSESFDFLGMLLASPGLALFLFGVSSIPGEGTVNSPRVYISAIVGLALMVAFVFHALRTEHPLIDLHLFKNKDLSVAVVTFLVFSIAFMGTMLLLPMYLIMVRDYSTLDAGLWLAPQGLGAMLTMPLAGALTDKIGAGKIVPPGIVLILIGTALFTQLSDTSEMWLGFALPLFIMGLGMGCTFMPVMSAAIATLTHEQVARGSTVMNVINQAGASIGTALMSMLLTYFLQEKLPAKPSDEEIAGIAAQMGTTPDDPGFIAQMQEQAAAAMGTIKPLMAEAFSSTFVVAVALIAIVMVPALMLPKGPSKPLEEGAAPIMVH